MDIANATAAGPSYGILDVIMGNVPKEEKAEGKEFEPMLNLIKALEKKKDEDGSADGGRTDKETSFGTNAVDYRFVNTPGINAAMNTSENQALLQWAEAQGLPKERAQATLLLATMKAEAKQQNVVPQQPSATVPQVSLQKLIDGNQDVYQNETKPQVSLQELIDGNQDVHQRETKEMNGTKVISQTIPEGFLIKEAFGKIDRSDFPVDRMLSTQEYLQLQKMQTDLPQSEQLIAKESHVISEGRQNLALEQNALPNSKINVAQNTTFHIAGGGMALTSKEFSRGAEDGAGGDKSDADSKEQPNIKLAGKADKMAMEQIMELPGHMDVNPADKTMVGGVLVKEIFLTNKAHNELRTGLMDEVSRSVSAQAVKGGGEMKLIIHPDNLGELKLKVSTKNDQVEVRVIADNDQVVGMLKKSAEELRSALSHQNLTLAKFDVNIADHTVNATSHTQNGQFAGFAGSQQQQQMNGNNNGGGRFSQSQEFSGMRENLGTAPKVRNMNGSKITVSSSRAQRGMNRLDVVA